MCTKSEAVDGVIIVSEGELSSEDIIKRILNVDNLPTPSVCNNNIKGYGWDINTKYYSAFVNLYSVSKKMEFNTEFCDTIQATIFYFNGKAPSSFESVLNWMPLLKNISSEVQLLVCENCDSNDDGNNKKNILNWCVENQFELIELSPNEESEEEDDGLFTNSKGFGRVIEALQSHTWSNLTMKRKSEVLGNVNKFIKSYTLEVVLLAETDSRSKKNTNTETSFAEGSNESDQSSVSSKPKVDTSKTVKVDDQELLLEEQLLQKVLEQDDADGESFEALFSKFASMKERANGLSGEERKKYAEKVAIAFWKAMGGEEDEIAGLDDD